MALEQHCKGSNLGTITALCQNSRKIVSKLMVASIVLDKQREKHQYYLIPISMLWKLIWVYWCRGITGSDDASLNYKPNKPTIY